MKSKLLARLAFTAGLAFSVGPTAAEAEILRFVARGTVDSVVQLVESAAMPVPSGIEVGSWFETIIDIDTTIPADRIYSLNGAGYQDPVFSSRAVVGGHEFSLPAMPGSSNVTAYDDARTIDGMYEDMLWIYVSGQAQSLQLSLVSLGPTLQSMISSPFEYWNAARFDAATYQDMRLAIGNYRTGGYEVHAFLDSLSVSTVPLPAGVWLLLSALSPLFAFARTRAPHIRN